MARAAAAKNSLIATAGRKMNHGGKRSVGLPGGTWGGVTPERHRQGDVSAHNGNQGSCYSSEREDCHGY